MTAREGLRGGAWCETRDGLGIRLVAPDEFPDIAAATGAMLIGRRTYEVGKRGIETASRGRVVMTAPSTAGGTGR